MRRTVLFNIIATVCMLQHCQVFGRSQSLTWEIDCSVLLPGCLMELELCAVCLTLKCVGIRPSDCCSSAPRLPKAPIPRWWDLVLPGKQIVYFSMDGSL